MPPISRPRLVVLRIFPALALLGIGGAGWISPAAAQNFSSSYSSTVPRACRVFSDHNGVDDSSTRVCPGPAGLVVLISESDLRETVSVGRNRKAAEAEPAAQTRFGPFNSTTDTIEWRARDGQPFAMIQRWSIADNDDPGNDGRPRSKQMLAVTRLPPGAVCHVGYIDVAANPDANTLARQAADQSARDFKCGTDQPKVIGVPGRATALALRR
jgi:hypothetical protein